jgi:VWFA-related protein
MARALFILTAFMLLPSVTLGLCLASVQALPETPTIAVETEVVHVEAMVTDKKGRPVRGLVKGDFVLYEDGKPVPIVAFEPSAPGADAEGASAARAPAGPPGAAPAPAPGAPTIVVYVDNRNLTPAGRRRALDGLASVLDRQLATGRVRALVVSEDRGVRALTTVTTSAEEVSRALAEAQRPSAQGALAASEERTTLDAMKATIELVEATGGTCLDALPVVQGIVRAHARARTIHHLETIGRIGDLAAALGALPGTKALLFLTEGLEQRPAIALFHQIGDACPQVLEREFSRFAAPMQEHDMSRALQDLAARASAARVTVYPVDAAGLRPPSVADVSYGDRRFTPSPRNDSVREANLRAGPWILAEETGGFPLFDRNQPSGALGSLSDELLGRYALGFTPAQAADGRAHTLRVALRRKDLRVRHRLSYFHAPSGETQVKRTYATLFFGYEEDGLGAAIEAELTGATTGIGPDVAVRISLPLARLATREDAEGRLGRLRVVMAVRRAGRAVTDTSAEGREKVVDLRLPPRPPGGDPATASREIVVRMPFVGDEQEIAVGVRDVFGGAETYRRLLVRR